MERRGGGRTRLGHEGPVGGTFSTCQWVNVTQWSTSKSLLPVTPIITYTWISINDQCRDAEIL